MFDKIKKFFAYIWKSLKDGFNQPMMRLHLICGFAIATVFGIGIGLIASSVATGIFAGLAFGLLAGIVKELWDGAGFGTVDIIDILFTTVGAICAIPVDWIVILLCVML